MSLSDSHHFRKLVAGICMVLAPLFLLASAIIHPETGTSAGSQAIAIARSPDAWYIAHMLALVSSVLAVPAVLGFMHMLRDKHAVEGHLGGALALIGLLAFVGVIAMELTFWRGGGPVNTAVLIDRTTSSPGIYIPFYVLSFGFAAGMLVLAYGLYAARAVHAAMAGCIAIGALCLAFAFPLAIGWLAVVGAAFLAVGFGTTGLMVLNETDAEWVETPEYHGIRPAGAT